MMAASLLPVSRLPSQTPHGTTVHRSNPSSRSSSSPSSSSYNSACAFTADPLPCPRARPLPCPLLASPPLSLSPYRARASSSGKWQGSAGAAEGALRLGLAPASGPRGSVRVSGSSSSSSADSGAVSAAEADTASNSSSSSTGGGEAAGGSAAEAQQTDASLDALSKEVSKAVKKTATTFAPRASTKTKNPAVPGSTLYTVFEVQGYATALLGGLLSFNLIFPSDEPDIWRLMGMWSIWMFTIPSLRARDCSDDEKTALNYLFLVVPLINVTLPLVYKSFAAVWSADVVAFVAFYAWKMGWFAGDKEGEQQ